MIFLIRSNAYIQNYWENIYKDFDSKTWIVYFDINKAFDADFFFFKIFTGCMCNFGFHVAILPLSSSLQNDTYSKRKRIINFSMLAYIIIYLMIGIIGFYWFPIKSPKSILVADKVFEMDWHLGILKIIVLFIAFFRIPINFFVFRISLNQIFNKSEISKNW